MNYDNIRNLNDDDTILVKTTLLLYMYSYYETNELLDNDLKKMFDKIVSLTKTSKSKPGLVNPPYFKMSIHDVKKIFAKAPTDIYTNLSFKEDETPKSKSK